MAKTPEPGTAAPDFTLDGTSAEGRRTYTLSDLRGRPVVLVFYPRDDTPVCTTQLCSYQDQLSRFDELDAVVLGISAQGIESHERFAARRGLTFPLLADPDKTVIRRYGVNGPLGTRRAIFVVDAEGTVRWKNVSTFGLTYQDVDTLTGVLKDLSTV